MMDFKKINFKQPKYMIPAIIYVPLLFTGYFIVDAFHVDTSGPENTKLKTTDYLSSELPEAYTDSVLGDKMDNTQREFGKISDLSGVKNVENDNDSVNKKKEFESKYDEDEAKKVRQQQAEEKRKLQEMQERVRQNRSSSNADDFVDPVSDSEVAKAQRRRRQRSWDEINKSLQGGGEESYLADGTPSSSASTSQQDGSTPSSVGGSTAGGNGYNSPTYGGIPGTPGGNYQNPGGSASQEGEQPEKVTKKTKEMSSYFNTVGNDKEKDKLIMAIIDENIKAVDGSRVRLRLLDDIEIGDEIIKKGTYLYATMSGFGKQRVQGKVESIFYNEDIIKVSLSIYDTDGMQGLYVPESNFRETTKEVASSAMQGGNILDNSSTSSNGIKGWATQAAQNASQRVMNALSSAAKKNRVHLKYGTRVYLMDGSQNERNNKKRNNY